MDKHTPTPWHFDDAGHLRDQNDNVVIFMAEENKNFIALCVNSHRDLVEALETIAKLSNSNEPWTHDEPWGNESDVWDNGVARGKFDAAVIARAALAKAKGD